MIRKNKRFQFTRRKLIVGAIGAATASAVGCGVDALLVEPHWLRITRLKLTPQPTTRIVHFSDMHYRGHDAYARKVMKRINGFSPDFVCFTGDLIDYDHHLDGALDHIARIRAPVYGVPGNHDFWSGASFQQIEACFSATGGAWLVNNARQIRDGDVKIYGRYFHPAYNSHEVFPYLKSAVPYSAPQTARQKQILLTHFPETADLIKQEKYDLVLAGHTHGGQVCIPFWGPVILPTGSGKYVRGLYKTPAGPLHVSVGIGTLCLTVRFCCRPEMTVIEI